MVRTTTLSREPSVQTSTTQTSRIVTGAEGAPQQPSALVATSQWTRCGHGNRKVTRTTATLPTMMAARLAAISTGRDRFARC